MRNLQKIKKEKRKRRHKRKRAKIKGTNERPRLSVFRSNLHIYCQLIDDNKGETLITANDFELKEIKKRSFVNIKGSKERSNKVNRAFLVGKLIAKKANKKGIKKIVFDTSGYKYHGRIKAVAEGAREGGLKF